MVGKGAPKGNKLGTKLKDKDVRQEAYKQYCNHIASGECKESFVFEHPTLTVTYKTMERYIRENPIEFPPDKKEAAEAASYRRWTKDGHNMMMGKVKGCQPAIYQMFMRNKFGWDKETSVKYSFEPEARTLLNKMEKD